MLQTRRHVGRQSSGFCRAMLCIIAAYAVVRCLSICLSVWLFVTFVDCVETNKHICNFLTVASHTILVFPYQALWQYSDEARPNRGVECRWSGHKSRFSPNVWLSDQWLLQCEKQLRQSTVQFTAQTATHQWLLFITACSMEDHDEENRTEQFNCMQR